jgi:hypothetical protein
MSTIKVNSIEEATSGGATFYTLKSWVNFNGKNTISIRMDGGVSSITDYGVGNYGVNQSTSMPDTNYSALAYAHEDTNGSKAGSWVANGTRTDYATSQHRHSYGGDANIFNVITAR